jgi:hypothetical protein
MSRDDKRTSRWEIYAFGFKGKQGVLGDGGKDFKG